MNRCDCGTEIPEDFGICWECESFADDPPTLPMEPLSAEDVKLNGMDQEAADYADVFGNLAP